MKAKIKLNGLYGNVFHCDVKTSDFNMADKYVTIELDDKTYMIPFSSIKYVEMEGR